jgi:hypothetical protein
MNPYTYPANAMYVIVWTLEPGTGAMENDIGWSVSQINLIGLCILMRILVMPIISLSFHSPSNDPACTHFTKKDESFLDVKKSCNSFWLELAGPGRKIFARSQVVDHKLLCSVITKPWNNTSVTYIYMVTTKFDRTKQAGIFPLGNTNTAYPNNTCALLLASQTLVSSASSYCQRYVHCSLDWSTNKWWWWPPQLWIRAPAAAFPSCTINRQLRTHNSCTNKAVHGSQPTGTL